MAYYRECPHCGAALDPGETCTCRDGSNPTGARLPAIQSPVPTRIEVKKSRRAMEYDMDRMIAALALARDETRREQRKKRGRAR